MDHALLGVSAAASWGEVKRAYRKRALQHHPDKGGDAEKFKTLQNAYERLERRHRDGELEREARERREAAARERREEAERRERARRDEEREKLDKERRERRKRQHQETADGLRPQDQNRATIRRLMEELKLDFTSAGMVAVREGLIVPRRGRRG
jgi:curved DNA-binding protein CbpA